MYSSAVAAGSVELQSETDLDAVIELLKRGVYGGGSFSTTLFQVPNLDEEAKREAKQHLELVVGETTDLAYVAGEHHDH